jgi:transcriptional regulator with XRE-family HTH domain
MNDFVDWLNEELNERGWGQNELARRAGVSGGSISHIVNRRKNPGFDVCVGIAEAFSMPPEAVLRRAGWMVMVMGVSARNNPPRPAYTAWAGPARWEPCDLEYST